MPEQEPPRDEPHAPETERPSVPLELSDEVQRAAVAAARQELSTITAADTIGDLVGADVVDPRTVTLWFASLAAGYVGWVWAATVTQVDDEAPVTVVEVTQLPGEHALTAPEWVPWSVRLQQYREVKAKEAADEAAAAEAAARELADEDDAEDDLLDNDFSDFDDEIDGVDIDELADEDDIDEDDIDDDGDDEDDDSGDGEDDDIDHDTEDDIDEDDIEDDDIEDDAGDV